MTMKPAEAVQIIYRGGSISPTREAYTTGGIRAELLSQRDHLTQHQDLERAGRFSEALAQLDEQFGFDVATANSVGKRPEGRLVTPRAFLVGYTTTNMQGIREYLQYTGQEDFNRTLSAAASKGVEPAEALTSFYAKLCYKSLVVGENANITQVRDIPGNIAGAQKQAHGSIFEHVSLNWVVTDCSRVYTHEQVRHRVGVAYSQTSGRYCRIEPGKLAIVFDPILEGCEDLIESCLGKIERTVYLIECRKNLRKPPFGLSADVVPVDAWLTPTEELDDVVHGITSRSKAAFDLIEDPNEGYKIEESEVRAAIMWVPTGKEDGVDFTYKKKLTSAARRLAPNGQTNEMGMTLNVRTLRHTIMMRTARFAEWEIRQIFAEIYQAAKAKWPLMFADAQEREVDGCIEVYGMKMNPYERTLTDYEDNELWGELYRRGVVEAEVAPVKPSEYDEAMAKATGGEVVAVGSGAEELPKEETGESNDKPSD